MTSSIRQKSLWIAMVVFLSIDLLAQRITINGTKFYVDGKEIWLNGANTPWHNWNDFGAGRFDQRWWENHMKALKDHGINCSRVWIACDGGGGIKINADGTVTGVTESFFSDLDGFFASAKANQLYIFATMLSFDHFQDGKPNFEAFRSCIQDSEKAGFLVDRYVVPFVNRYKDNPYLFAIDACNEIEWVHEETRHGNIAWGHLQYLVARMAAGVHENSSIPFTVGSAAVKWNGDSLKHPVQGNQWSDSALRSRFQNPKAFLDFYSPHWYGWVARWFGNPCEVSPSEYGIGDRPCIIGECPSKGMFIQNEKGADNLVFNPTEMLEKTYHTGWRGIFPWTSNGVDPVGSLSDFGAGSRAFRDNHADLVFPSDNKINEVRLK
jgi:hypothetical protein